MAASYEVCMRRQQKLQSTGQTDKVAYGLAVDYQIEVSGVDPTLIDILDVEKAPGLPVVNGSTWLSPDGLLLSPYLVCREMSLEQSRDRLELFTAKTKWKGETREGSYSIPPPASVTDIAPQETIEIGAIERVLYEDKSAVPKRIALPSGNMFAQPQVETIPTQNIRLSQYESFIAYDTMQARSYKVNATTYRGKPPGSWLMGPVEASEVKVELVGGQTDAALVTYPISYNPTPEGWLSHLALIDTAHLDAGTFKAFLEGELRTINYGLVDSTGVKKPDQQGLPDYVDYQVFDAIDFTGFLQA